MYTRDVISAYFALDSRECVYLVIIYLDITFSDSK
jgi:hypothetical protein